MRGIRLAVSRSSRAVAARRVGVALHRAVAAHSRRWWPITGRRVPVVAMPPAGYRRGGG
jgi:hypothetical protein